MYCAVEERAQTAKVPERARPHPSTRALWSQAREETAGLPRPPERCRPSAEEIGRRVQS